MSHNRRSRFIVASLAAATLLLTPFSSAVAADALVVLACEPGVEVSLYGRGLGGREVKTATCNSDGAFFRINPGAWTIEARKSGFQGVFSKEYRFVEGLNEEVAITFKSRDVEARSVGKTDSAVVRERLVKVRLSVWPPRPDPTVVAAGTVVTARPLPIEVTVPLNSLIEVQQGGKTLVYRASSYAPDVTYDFESFTVSWPGQGSLYETLRRKGESKLPCAPERIEYEYGNPDHDDCCSLDLICPDRGVRVQQGKYHLYSVSRGRKSGPSEHFYWSSLPPDHWSYRDDSRYATCDRTGDCRLDDFSDLGSFEGCIEKMIDGCPNQCFFDKGLSPAHSREFDGLWLGLCGA